MKKYNLIDNLVHAAELEFRCLEQAIPDAIVLPFKNEIINLYRVFAESGQSGGSAPYTVNAITDTLKKLCLSKPLTDIEDDNWSKVTANLYQNKRLSSVFKENGQAYYLDAIVWVDTKHNIGFSGTVYKDINIFKKITSRQFINFPFSPKTFEIETIDITFDSLRKLGISENVIKTLTYGTNTNYEKYITVVKNPDDLLPVFEYYKTNNTTNVCCKKKMKKNQKTYKISAHTFYSIKDVSKFLAIPEQDLYDNKYLLLQYTSDKQFTNPNIVNKTRKNQLTEGYLGSSIILYLKNENTNPNIKLSSIWVENNKSRASIRHI